MDTINIKRRDFLNSVAATTLLGTFGSLAAAQTVDTVRIITGYAAGGTADMICRRVATKLTGTYAKSVVVENRTGGGGVISIQALKNSAPDGTTLLLLPLGLLSVFPHVYKQLPYDPVADLTPVSTAANYDFGFAVGPAVPDSIQTAPQFLEWCKANPTQANFGSPATGSSTHFIGVLLGRSGGVELNHVAYRGTQPAIVDLIGGHIAAVSGPLGDFMPHLSGGKCRLIGTAGPKRSPFTPQVATFSEQGIKDKDLSLRSSHSFYLPANATPDVVQRLNAALVAALAEPDLVQAFAEMGMEAASSSSVGLTTLIQRDTERWKSVVKRIGFTAES